MQKKDVYKLTNPQKNIWNMELYYKGTAINNICGSVLIKEITDLKILSQAINKFIENNDSFRTRIKLIDSTPYQYFIDNKIYEFGILNFNNIDELTSYAKKMASKPFEIIETQLFDFKLFKLSNNYGGFIINAHHIISDAATFSLVGSEITSNYLKIKSHQEIPTKTYSYIDYIEAEQKYMQSSRFENDKKYWNDLYKDLPSITTIPSSKNDVESISANRLELKLNKDLFNKINQFCKINKVSVFSFLMAIYSIYIGKINNADTFSIGTPILNRSNFAQKHTSGMFISTSMLKIKINNDITFKELIHNISQTSLSMLKHQKYDYQYILNDLRQNNPEISNLYDVALSYQITKATDTSLAIDYESTWYMTPFISNSIDIHFHDNNDSGNLIINYDYKICKYEQKDIINMHKRILHILNQIINNPDLSIKDLEITTNEEKSRIINEFNNLTLNYEKNKTIVNLFEEQVIKTPNNIAVIFKNHKLTYKELNEKANKFANYLLKQGITKNSIIPVILNRSIDLIVSMLSIIKLGAVYLPITPDTPDSRIKYIIENSNSTFAISQSNNHLNLKIKVINIDNVDCSKYNNKNPHISIEPSDLLYIIYTSGSTGMPKGVQVCHKNLVNFINSFTNLYGNISSQDRLLASTNISFDVSIFEMYISLLNGCTLYLYDEPQINDVYGYCKSIIDNKITFAYIPPNILEIVYNILAEYHTVPLNKLLLGVEPIKTEIIKKYYSLNPNFKIINAYGPTETTICATAILLDKHILDTYTTLPIGKPLHNLKIYILDNNMRPVPIGVPGEIYIAGDNVSNGYLNNPTLTNKAFISIPNLDCKYAYKTGDLGKWDKYGIINFIGRTDNQIKLNGHRIELGEIESQIYSYSEITKVIVLVNKNNKLVCYFTSNSKIDVKELKQFLANRLPIYLIPNYFVQIEKFELTPNGKINRKSLPEVEYTRSSEKLITSRNKTDKKLIEIIKPLLHLDNISIDDDFFELGGDSLSAINLCVQIQDEFNAKLFVKDILEHPQIQDLSDIISKRIDNTNSLVIPTIKEADFYEVSSAQKRIYFASNVAGKDSVLYNIPGGVVFDKIIDASKLENCLNTLINRHEALRTYFELKNETVVQKIVSDLHFKLDIIEDANFEDLDNIFNNFVKPFDLAKAPLFRVKFIKFTNGKSALLIDMHHIISDGTSMSIFTDELSKLYNGKNLPEMNITYKDFSAFENNRLNSGKLKEAEDYWVHQFEDEIPLLNMPTNHQRPAVQTYEGKRVHSKINYETTTKIEQISKDLGVTPYMILLACYYILLSKYTSQDDIVVGSPIVGRDIKQTYSLIGMFVNTLALRNKINNNSSFKDFVLQIKQNMLDAYKNQSYPFDELVNKLNIKRDTSRNPLFDTMFIYQNNGVTNLDFNNTLANLYIPDVNISKFDLSLEAIPQDTEIELSFEYATKLFNEDFIKALSNHYLNILNNVLADTDITISSIEMLSEEEKHKILYDFNNTNVDYPKNKTIVDLFEEQVQKTPDNIALVFENQKLTYKELNEKANSLAHYLQNKGVKQSDVISIFLDKSIESIIAIIATLKCGSTYMPIDVDYPDERINYMIKNSNSKCVLTSKFLKEKTSELINVIYIDLDNADIYSKKYSNIKTTTSPDNLAYIMYTSGSTGNPKGVMVTNKNIVRLVKNNKFIHFKEKEKILQTGSIVFDACTFEIWGALLNGFELYVIKKQDLLDPATLENYLKENKITILWVTAPLFNQLSENNPQIFSTARILLTGGDVLSPKHINLVKNACPNLTIINGYGPTENTTFSTCFTISKQYEASIPIGYPISNSTCFVVSQDLQLVPIGVPGELLVGGDGVSKGYLNNPEQTKSKFIPSIFEDGILYKTGDSVKWNKDGSIEFLGRIDNQVKIRGFRVELNEINLAIQKFKGIKECFTVVKLINNEKEICSYFSSNNDITINALKDFLKGLLPYYAMPKFLIHVKALPLNANGKVNVAKLPAPQNQNIKKEIIPSRNKTDKKLIEIIKPLLHLDNISIDDDFFELGGDSLSAINLCVQIQDEFNAKLFVKDILEHPQIQDLSDIISKRIDNTNSLVIPTIKEADFYEVSSAQKRIYFASNVAGKDSVLYNIPGGVVFDKIIDASKLENCLNTLINRHEALRTYFELKNETVVQKIVSDLHFKLDIIEDANFEDLDNIFNNFVKPFDLAKAPLFRVKFIKFTNGKSALLIDMHHIISDGTSMSIFTDELSKLYNGKNLPEMNITYKDFSAFENNRLNSGKLKEAEDYWVHQFEDEIPLLNMPTNHQRPAVQTYEGKRVHSKINYETTTKIEQISKDLGVTPYMILLACYYILLSKYTSQDDIVVGSPIVGRDIKQTYSLIGMFVNTLALRNKINNNSSFKDFVLQIKQNMLDAYKNQSYPFDELVNKLNIKRDTSRNPLFDTMFIYQNNGVTNLDFNNTLANLYIPDVNISKFDLSLEAIPQDTEIELSFEYATKLFNEDFIKALSNHYLNILNNVLADTDITISSIEMLSEEEKHKILYDFNNTNVDYPKNKTIVDLFEEQVQKTPDNIALVFENQKLTYKELNEKANSLAHYLRNTRKITRNDMIGIMVNRSLEMIVAIIGVLKSGAAYIPIDPTFPKDRIAYMLENSNAKLLLTQKHLKDKVNFSNSISIDLETHNIYNKKAENPEYINNPQDLAYVIFTSGSTGNPKGVMLKHNNIVNFIFGIMKEFKFSNKDTIVSLTTISFDIFVLESLMPLLNGLKVIITNEKEQTNIKLFNNLCLKNNVNIIQATPSRMQTFLLNLENLDCIKNATHILIGGEPFSKSLLKSLKQLSTAKIYNMYGPTETAVWSTLKDLTKTDTITIGYPIINTQVYILDNNLKPTPIGVPGKIYISGDGVSNGYLNNPELTNKSFTQNPYISGTLMYNTGDMGVYNENGEIVCLGRFDNQIKIRGLRIELGEIEATILKYPNIKKAVVVKQSVNNREFITTYYVTTKKIDSNNLKKYISTFLPKYMVPTYYIALNDLPYTPNGKIDKKALPLPSKILNITKEKYIAPQTDLQKKIADIWKKILNIQSVGINDNFFELGGDSLLAMNLNLELTRISRNITYQDIFRYPTIAQLEEKIIFNNDEPYLSKIQDLSDSFVDVLKKCTNIKRTSRYHPKGILLTGATGFLGIHILEQFIKYEKGNIYCIVRDGKDITARTKLYKKLNYYFGNKYDNLLENRIFVITGNITQPGFGLAQDELLNLANSVDLIINSAANVFHFGNYNEFYNTNVKSVKYIIDFCKSFNKKLYHISTISVAGENTDLSYPINKKKQQIIFDESSLYVGQPLNNIYTRTKFEAETHVLNAVNSKLDGYILRMGHLSPRYRDGIFQENILENDMVNKIISFIKIGIFPDYLLKYPMELTPIDQSARAIYKIITHPNNINRIFHIYNHNFIYPYQIIKILKKFRYNIKILPESDFKKQIKSIIDNDKKRHLLKNLINDFNKDLHLDYKTDIIIKSDFTIKYLKKKLFRWKKFSNKYLVRFINLLRKEI